MFCSVCAGRKISMAQTWPRIARTVPSPGTNFTIVSARAAAFLRDLGIQKGDRVAVWMLNSHEYLELYYATAMAGIVIVPLNTRWHESDVAFTLTDSDSVALIVDQSFAPLVESSRAPTRHLRGRWRVPAGHGCLWLFGFHPHLRGA